MAKTKNKTHTLLAGQDAMALWRQGKDSWNSWVDQNPEADIKFDTQRFEPNGKDYLNRPVIEFRGFKFPNGYVHFIQTYFAKGRLDFSGANFGCGNVNFFGAIFDSKEVNFSNATFGDGDVNFSNTSFLGGDLNFQGAAFGDGNVDFDDATLGPGNVDFRGSSFGRGATRFHNLVFQGTGRFTRLARLDQATSFSFEGCSFEKLFTFSHEGKMGCPLDLRRTKISHNVVLNDVYCDFDFERKTLWAKKAKKKEDSQRFRRLKELALNNRNHAKALEFHVQEIRTRRGHETNWVQDAGQTLYWALSDYGRSFIRPIFWLIALWLGSAWLQWRLRMPFTEFPTNTLIGVGDLTRDQWTALTYSASNMLSFIPTGRTARQQGEVLLHGGLVPDCVLLLNGAQSIVAVILLFLLSLSLRNMFRV